MTLLGGGGQIILNVVRRLWTVEQKHIETGWFAVIWYGSFKHFYSLVYCLIVFNGCEWKLLLVVFLQFVMDVFLLSPAHVGVSDTFFLVKCPRY
jgi:hypothetical protein